MDGSASKPPLKAVALLSGGLDSALAIRLVQEQGVQVFALHALNPFDDDRNVHQSPAARSAERLGIPMMTYLKGPDFIDLLRHPEHGYGSGMNPCLDCRIHLLRHARKVMEEIGAQMIVTGEVLGQRPMSQQRHQLALIARRAGVEDCLLQPLSARLMPETRFEREGRIDRSKLEGIAGRGRRRQLELARQFGLTGITSGAGGCRLTEAVYAARVRDLFAHRDTIPPEDFRLLGVGRHFRLSEETKAVMGRHDEENLALRSFLQPGRRLWEPLRHNGPSLLLEGEPDERVLRRVRRLLSAYTKPDRATPDGGLIFALLRSDAPAGVETLPYEPTAKDDLARYRIGE